MSKSSKRSQRQADLKHFEDIVDGRDICPGPTDVSDFVKRELRGECAPNEVTTMQRHLRECAECAEFYDLARRAEVAAAEAIETAVQKTKNKR